MSPELSGSAVATGAERSELGTHMWVCVCCGVCVCLCLRVCGEGGQ